MKKILLFEQSGESPPENRVFPASYDGSEGFLTLLSDKLLFIELKGFLQPHFKQILEVAYADIDAYDEVANNIVITARDGTKHCITVFNMPPLTVTTELSDLVIQNMIDSGIKKIQA